MYRGGYRKKGGVKTATAAGAVILAVLLTLVGYFQSGREEKRRLPDADAAVHFIDVGQGDCTLITSDGHAILIDAGEPAYGDKVADYIAAAGIEKIDVLVATHPHSDHIGGLPEVIERIPVDRVVMPRLPEALTPATQVYETLLTCLSQKEIPVTPAEPGETLQAGALAMRIVAPLAEYDDLNSMSVGCVVEFSGARVFVGGDMATDAERDVLDRGEDVSADIMKLSHHGSRYSNSEAFLNAVGADYYVASVGAGNSYGHPHEEVVDRLAGKAFYRTDQSGTVVFYIKDGALKVKTQKEAGE